MFEVENLKKIKYYINTIFVKKKKKLKQHISM